MLKLANQVIDAYDDVAREGLRKIAHLRPDCYVMTPDERAQLPAEKFALALITKKAHRLNKFPVDTADNAWLSAQYFEMNHAKLPEGAAKLAAANIKAACDSFQLPVGKAVETWAALCKEACSNVYYEASADQVKTAAAEEVSLEKFAAVREIGDNYTHAQFVMATPAHVKVASRYFAEQHDKIPVEYRHKYAAAIQRRAHELGMGKQGGLVAKYASDHYAAQVDAHVRSRISLVEFTNPEAKGAYEKLAAAKTQMTPSEFAVTMAGLDKKAGLARYYGGQLQDPFVATFGQEPDQYAGYRTKVAGTTMQSDDLKKLAVAKYAKIKEYFGHSLADEFKRDPVAIFDSLPMDVKEAMVGIANGTL